MFLGKYFSCDLEKMMATWSNEIAPILTKNIKHISSLLSYWSVLIDLGQEDINETTGSKGILGRMSLEILYKFILSLAL